MAFTLTLLSDVRGWLKGTADVEKSLDQVADSLDDLARDTDQNAAEAGDKLAREFSDAFDKVKRDARDTGRAIGDDVQDGTRRAGEGVDGFKEESHQSAREAAASFRGEFEDVGDIIQEVLANAFEGFGPAGAAAGVAAAAGIGIALSMLQQATDQANQNKDAVVDLAKELGDVHGNPALLQWGDRLKEKFLQIADANAWQTFIGDKPQAELQKLTAQADRFGVSMSDLARIYTGDQDAMARVTEHLTGKYRDLITAYQQGDDVAARQAGDVMAFRDSLQEQAGAVSLATDLNKAWQDSFGGVTDKLDGAAQASQAFSDNLTNHLSVADEGLDSFVKDGKLKLSEWSKALRERAREAQTVEDFTVTIAPKLSQEALDNFAQLPTETQAQIAKAYNEGSGKQKRKVVANLEAEAKIASVTIDAKTAQAATKTPIQVPTTIDASALPADVAKAAETGQDVANRSANVIELRTKIDRDDLQRQVNRAAAAITPPTITVKTKVQKEQP